MSDRTLDLLLDLDLALDPVMGAGLSNHLPMALVALDALGADEHRLTEFADGYRARLRPRRSGDQPVAGDDLRAVLGTGRRYADLLAFYERRLADEGAHQVLEADLPLLLGGLGGAAFHGVIRLAYACEHGRAADLAAGLAYLADEHHPVPCGAGASPGPAPAPADVLRAIADEPTLRTPPAGARFADRFAEASSRPALVDLVSGVRADDRTLGRTARLAHDLYRSTGDFFALHAMTATHATRVVIGHLSDAEDRRRAVEALVAAVGATYVAIGCPPFRDDADGESPVGPAWDVLARAAVRSDDEHVVKLVHTCVEEDRAWGEHDGRYRSTAALAVETLP